MGFDREARDGLLCWRMKFLPVRPRGRTQRASDSARLSCLTSACRKSLLPCAQAPSMGFDREARDGLLRWRMSFGSSISCRRPGAEVVDDLVAARLPPPSSEAVARRQWAARQQSRGADREPAPVARFSVPEWVPGACLRVGAAAAPPKRLRVNFAPVLAEGIGGRCSSPRSPPRWSAAHRPRSRRAAKRVARRRHEQQSARRAPCSQDAAAQQDAQRCRAERLRQQAELARAAAEAAEAAEDRRARAAADAERAGAIVASQLALGAAAAAAAVEQRVQLERAERTELAAIAAARAAAVRQQRKLSGELRRREEREREVANMRELADALAALARARSVKGTEAHRGTRTCSPWTIKFGNRTLGTERQPRRGDHICYDPQLRTCPVDDTDTARRHTKHTAHWNTLLEQAVEGSGGDVTPQQPSERARRRARRPRCSGGLRRPSGGRRRRRSARRGRRRWRRMERQRARAERWPEHVARASDGD